MAKLIGAVANTPKNTDYTQQETHWVSITKTNRLNVVVKPVLNGIWASAAKSSLEDQNFKYLY